MSAGAGPSDEETARLMVALAEAFRSGAAEDTGLTFGWDEPDAQLLDPLCASFLRGTPDPEVQHSLVMAMGAYLGELIVRNGGGRWIYDHEQLGPAVELPRGMRAYPHHKVAKRLDGDAEHQLWPFYVYAVRGEPLPGTEESSWQAAPDGPAALWSAADAPAANAPAADGDPASEPDGPTAPRSESDG